MVKAEDIKYVRNCTECTIQESKAIAQLLVESGLDIYSDEAAATMHMYHFREKAIRYAKYLEIKRLIKEFGPLED